ncbi:MAG: 3-phosphoshikimate 1-carboxyvinyltransferase [bacterium]|nr:3-phosphoshikimate 1-carboxyvinyltransferase [bacterium]
MTKSIKPSVIKGKVIAPASKSMMQRAIAASLLSKTPVRLSNLTYSNDSSASLSVIEGLGASVERGEHEVVIGGRLNPSTETLHCGESGLGIRMFSPIAALWHEPLTLTGEGSLLKRPVTMMEKPLKQLGVAVVTTDGCPPLTVTGPLRGGEAAVDGSVSSQFLTGLLMALPYAGGDSRLTVKDLKSKPYIDMTVAFLKRFGVVVCHDNYETFYIKGNQTYRLGGDSGAYRVEGDWSGAAFLLAAGAVGGEVIVSGLDMNSPQADRKILEALEAAGASVRLKGAEVEVRGRRGSLRAFEFDATHCPDLFPPLVALACNCEGTTVLTGVERLIHKESNRAVALEKEFTALGGDVRVTGNRMEIVGKRLSGGVMDSHNDHRIAMAGAVAAINAEDDVIINGYRCVAKSYPGFFGDFQSIGGNVYE